MVKQFFLLCLMGLTTSLVHAEKINLKGSDGFDLYGDYKAASSHSSKGVLMLHQCNADRGMYIDLAAQLAESGFSSMSLDFRGFGESSTQEMSITAIRSKAKSREHYFELVEKAGLGSHRKNDVELAYQFLLEKLGDEASISVIGASCGGTQAVVLAQKHNLNSFIFFSSGMNDATIELFSNVSHVPALMIAAQKDEYTFKSLNKIFLAAESKKTRLLSYKGNGHGIPLFKQDPGLQDMMVEWFKQHSTD